MVDVVSNSVTSKEVVELRKGKETIILNKRKPMPDFGICSSEENSDGAIKFNIRLNKFKGKIKSEILNYMFNYVFNLEFSSRITENEGIFIGKKFFSDFLKNFGSLVDLYSRVSRVDKNTDPNELFNLIELLGVNIALYREFSKSMKPSQLLFPDHKVHVPVTIEELMVTVEVYEEEFIKFVKSFLKFLNTVTLPHNEEKLHIEDDFVDYFHNSIKLVEKTTSTLYDIFTSNSAPYSVEEVKGYAEYLVTCTNAVENLTNFVLTQEKV